MYNSSISQLLAESEKPKKKIIPSSKMKGLREEFKKTFLPLLIDVFELRQMIKSAKGESHDFFEINHKCKSPEEIMLRLKELQSDIEESQRWCNGVISQISKGINEVQQALEPNSNKDIDRVVGNKNNLLITIRNLFKKKRDR